MAVSTRVPPLNATLKDKVISEFDIIQTHEENRCMHRKTACNININSKKNSNGYRNGYHAREKKAGRAASTPWGPEPTTGAVHATDSHKYYQMTLASVDEKYRIRAAAHTATSFGVCPVLHAACPRRALS